MIVGDCVEVMKGFKTNSFDAIVTSPPYNIGINYGEGISDNLGQEEYNNFTKDWLFESLRLAKVAVVNFGNKTSYPMGLAHFMISANKVGFVQQDITWAKSISTPEFSKGHFKPVNSDRYITNVVEHIFVISRDGNYPLDKLSVGVPFADKSNISRFKGNSSDLRCRGNLWFLPYKTRVKKVKHPATYPPELAEMMIKLVSARSVLDPFHGLGNTEVACKNLGVSYEGIDKRDWQC